MNKEKQIEEMAKVLCGMKNGCDGCMWDKVHCSERNYAEEIYNAGYRKQSEVAREIFEEFEKLTQIRESYPHIMTFNQKGYAELKKKYTEVENGTK